MSEWQEFLRQSDDGTELGPDFEKKVFCKIKKRKRQKKINFAIMSVVGVVLLLSLLQLFRPGPRQSLISSLQAEKEEIPLSEDMFFSASDNLTRYSLEPVSYQKKQDNQPATPNQI
jgi:hypothetical protein